MELSSLIPELDQKGVNLVGVVHEEKGAKEFQPFLSSPLYLDEEVNKCQIIRVSVQVSLTIDDIKDMVFTLTTGVRSSPNNWKAAC